MEWISVEERLPEHGTHVLVWRPSCTFVPEVVRYITVDDKYHGGFWHGIANLHGVTHWMPLPEPPKP